MILRHFSPQAEWKPEAENSADHSVCRIQTIYMDTYYHVYIAHWFTLLDWRKKNTWGVVFKIEGQSAKEMIGAFSSLS